MQVFYRSISVGGLPIAVGLFLLLLVTCKRTETIDHTAKGITSASTEKERNISCSFSRNEKNIYGQHISVIEEEKFVGLPFSDSINQKQYRGDDFIKGYLACVQVDTLLGIYFNWVINSPEADLWYGGIKKGKKIIFILASDKRIELSFAKTFTGNTNLSRGFSSYSSLVYLPPKAATSLKSEPLRHVKMEWANKEEIYSVINPTVLVRQLACLE